MIKKNILFSVHFVRIFLLLFIVSPIFAQNKQTSKTEKTIAKITRPKPTKISEKIAIQDSILNIVPQNDSIKTIGTVKYILNQKSAGASYYADKFTGRRTASGKIFNNNAYTCAHRKLPFGTKLRVTSERTNKSVYVTVTDRGPFVRGRHIDLSKRAFFDIAPKSYGGSIPVTIEIVK